eukprot:1016971-Pleurochrysis_carterae.AAC.1
MKRKCEESTRRSAKGLKIPRRARLVRGDVCRLRTSRRRWSWFPCPLREMTTSMREARLGSQCSWGARERESRGRAGSVRGQEPPLRTTCGR